MYRSGISPIWQTNNVSEEGGTPPPHFLSVYDLLARAVTDRAAKNTGIYLLNGAFSRFYVSAPISMLKVRKKLIYLCALFDATWSCIPSLPLK